MKKEPAESQNTYDLISDLVLELSYLYSFHKSVYKSRERIAQMKQISDPLFGLIQRSLQHDIIRMICILTDPPGNGKNTNATIAGMISELESINRSCRDKCQEIYDGIEEPLSSIRAHRHKRLFHIDRKTRRLKNENLPRMLIGHIDSAVDGICQIMNKAHSALKNSSTDFREVLDPSHASDVFNWMISDCIRFRELRTLARDSDVSDAKLRRLVSERSDRNDERILADDD